MWLHLTDYIFFSVILLVQLRLRVQHVRPWQWPCSDDSGGVVAAGRLKTQVRVCNGGKRKYSNLKSILKSLRFSSLAFSVDPLSVDQFTCTVPTGVRAYIHKKSDSCTTNLWSTKLFFIWLKVCIVLAFSSTCVFSAPVCIIVLLYSLFSSSAPRGCKCAQ